MSMGPGDDALRQIAGLVRLVETRKFGWGKDEDLTRVWQADWLVITTVLADNQMKTLAKLDKILHVLRAAAAGEDRYPHTERVQITVQEVETMYQIAATRGLGCNAKPPRLWFGIGESPA